MSSSINIFYAARKHFDDCSSCKVDFPCDAMEKFAVSIEIRNYPLAPASSLLAPVLWIKTFSFYHDKMLNCVLNNYMKFSEDFVDFESIADVIVNEKLVASEALNKLKIEVLARGDYDNVLGSRFYQEEDFARLFYRGLPAEYCLGVVL